MVILVTATLFAYASVSHSVSCTDMPKVMMLCWSSYSTVVRLGAVLQFCLQRIILLRI